MMEQEEEEEEKDRRRIEEKGYVLYQTLFFSFHDVIAAFFFLSFLGRGEFVREEARGGRVGGRT